jgi:Mg2+/citrate symporter
MREISDSYAIGILLACPLITGTASTDVSRTLGIRKGRNMNPFRLLIIALLPLLIVNVLLWGLYAHSVVASMGWGVASIFSTKLANWSEA